MIVLHFKLSFVDVNLWFYCIKFDLPSDSYLHFNGMGKDYFGRAIKECLKILKVNSDVVN
jgi:hypothetical protein